MTRPLPHEAERHVDHPDGRRTADVAGVDVPRTGGLRALDGTTHVTMRDPTVRVRPAARHGRPEAVQHPFPSLGPFLFTAAELERIGACNRMLATLPELAVALPSPPTDAKGGPVHDRAQLSAFVASYEAVARLCQRHHTALEKLARLRQVASEATKASPTGLGWTGPAVGDVYRSLPVQEEDETGATWVTRVENFIAEADSALRARIETQYRGHLADRR